MATYLSLIRESNLPKNVRGRARGKHHTADNSSATALKRRIQDRVSTSAGGRRNTLFGDKLGITGLSNVQLTNEQRQAIASKPTAVQLAEASNGATANFKNVSLLLGDANATEITDGEFRKVIAANPTNAQFAAASANPPALDRILGAAAAAQITIDELTQFGFNDPLSTDLTQFQKDAIIADKIGDASIGTSTIGALGGPGTNATFITRGEIINNRAIYGLSRNDFAAQNGGQNPTDQELLDHYPGAAIENLIDAAGSAAAVDFTNMNANLFTNNTAPANIGHLTAVEVTNLVTAPGTRFLNAAQDAVATTGGFQSTFGFAAEGQITAAELIVLRRMANSVRANPTNDQVTAANANDLSTVGGINTGAATITQLTLAELTTLGLNATQRLTASQKAEIVAGDLRELGAANAGFITAAEIVQQRNAQPTAAQSTAAAAADLTTVGAQNVNKITAAELVAANTNADNNISIRDGPRINQKPKGGNQGTYLYYKSIFPRMSLNSVTRQ